MTCLYRAHVRQGDVQLALRVDADGDGWRLELQGELRGRSLRLDHAHARTVESVQAWWWHLATHDGIERAGQAALLAAAPGAMHLRPVEIRTLEGVLFP